MVEHLARTFIRRILSVLQVISSNDRRGDEVFAVDLNEELRRLGTQVDIVALVDGGGTNPMPVPVLGRRRFRPTTLVALRRLASKSAVTIAHGSSTLPASVMATAFLRTPIVYRNIGDPDFWAAAALRRTRVRYLLSRVAAIAAIWSGSAATLVRNFGVPASKIEVIPNGRPANRFPIIDELSRRRGRERLGVNGPVVVYIGSLSAEKRLDLAIRATAAIPDATLLIAGTGPLRSSIEQLADDEAPGRVRFLGSVPDTAAVLAAGDVVLLCSSTEGLPGVLIEAGLSGLPAVATDAGGTSTIIEDGVTGAVVPVGDLAALTAAVRQVLADPGTMGAAAHRRCLERFEIGPVTRQWEGLLARIVATR